MKEIDDFEIETIQASLTKATPEFAKRIAPLYRQLNWVLAGNKEPPTVKHIEHTVFGLIKDLNTKRDEKFTAIETAGIRVFIDRRDGITYGLEFTVRSVFFGNETCHSKSWDIK